MSLAMKNNHMEMLLEVCKIIGGEEVKFDVDANIINPVPDILWFKFDYKK